MKLIVDRLDVAKTRENWPVTMPFAPAIVNKRKKLGAANWHVLAEQFVPGTAPQWANAAHDDYVRVPLFSYMLNPEADLALAFPLQVGLACASYLPAGITHLYVATGYPVELLYDSDTDINTGLRYWFGFAVATA
jgi:hypothetical protein